MRKFVWAFVLAGLLSMGTISAYADENVLDSTVKELYGVPYKASGTSTRGFDCSGFTQYVFQKLGVDIPHSSAAQYQMGKAVERSQLLPGDLVFFKTNGHSVSHVGIYLGNNTFIHSESGVGVVKTKLTDPYYWSERYVGAKRIALPALQDSPDSNQMLAQSKKKSVQAASITETAKKPSPQKKH
ncbi:C40 family peptidase [Brevibacillus ginsengisoli]|uniref:C40 family peptidase n=1 Tax=Brevibacillus ginsengisoli TaxID=363854 RepID=UPI003CEA5939